MTNIGFHIENGVQSGIQPAAIIIPIIDPAQHREVITSNHRLANSAWNR